MALIKTYTNDVAGLQAKLLDHTVLEMSANHSSTKVNYENRMRNMFTDDSGAGGLTVQQKFDAFGKDAASLLSISHSVALALVAVDPGYQPSTAATYGFSTVSNQDGTVTVSAL